MWTRRPTDVREGPPWTEAETGGRVCSSSKDAVGHRRLGPGTARTPRGCWRPSLGFWPPGHGEHIPVVSVTQEAHGRPRRPHTGTGKGQQHSRACGVPAVARLEGPRPHSRVPTCPWSLAFPTQSEAITEEEAPQTPASVTGGCVKLWSGTILICADDAFVSLTTCIERDHLEAKWPTCHGHPCGPPQDRHSQRRPQGTPACGQCLVLHSNLNLDSLC